jgi:hypothetical protein
MQRKYKPTFFVPYETATETMTSLFRLSQPSPFDALDFTLGWVFIDQDAAYNLILLENSLQRYASGATQAREVSRERSRHREPEPRGAGRRRELPISLRMEGDKRRGNVVNRNKR